MPAFSLCGAVYHAATSMSILKPNFHHHPFSSNFSHLYEVLQYQHTWSFPASGDGSTETKDLQAMERDILLDNFASLTVRQAIRFPLVGERPKPPKNPDGCFRLPSKVRQALRRSAQKKCRRQYRNDTACGIVFISPAIARSSVFPLHAPAVQHRSGASCPHCA